MGVCHHGWILTWLSVSCMCFNNHLSNLNIITFKEVEIISGHLERVFNILSMFVCVFIASLLIYVNHVCLLAGVDRCVHVAGCLLNVLAGIHTQ